MFYYFSNPTAGCFSWCLDLNSTLHHQVHLTTKDASHWIRSQACRFAICTAEGGLSPLLGGCADELLSQNLANVMDTDMSDSPGRTLQFITWLHLGRFSWQLHTVGLPLAVGLFSTLLLPGGQADSWSSSLTTRSQQFKGEAGGPATNCMLLNWDLCQQTLLVGIFPWKNPAWCCRPEAVA